MNDTLSELKRLVEQITDLATEGSYGSAVLMREDALDIIDKLQAQAAEPVAIARNDEAAGCEYYNLKVLKPIRAGAKLYTTPKPSAPAVPEGWQLVPLIADARMREAYYRSGGAQPTWRAMLQAAPQAQDTEVKK